MPQKYKITTYIPVNQGTNTKRIKKIRNLTYNEARVKKEELKEAGIEFKVELD